MSETPRREFGTLSDGFMAHVAIAACRPRTAAAMKARIEAKLEESGHTLPPEKRADLLAVVEWLRMCEGEP